MLTSVMRATEVTIAMIFFLEIVLDKETFKECGGKKNEGKLNDIISQEEFKAQHPELGYIELS